MSYFTNAEKDTVWWYDNDANTPDGLVSITEAAAMAIAHPAPGLEEQAQAIRAERDVRLRKADYAINMAEDAGLDTEALRAYRQALRDVPQQPGFPDSVVWPEQPEGDVQAAVENEGMTETQAAAVPQTA